MNASPHIVDVTQESFERDVLERSRQVPVLVDFWADWCGPCKILTPVLAQLVQAYAGKFVLAKVDTEAEQELAARHGIRSIPTLKLYKNGAQVEELQGALPESALRQLLDRYIEREADALRREAEQLWRDGDSEAALEVLDRAVALDPDYYPIQVDRVRILLSQGELDQARGILQILPLNVSETPEVNRLTAQLQFAELVADAPDLAALEQRVQAEPGDHEARHQLAARLVAGRYDEAMEQFLQLLQRDRSYGDDAGRRGLLAVFDLLGGEGDLVARYRRRMFNLLH